MTQPIVAPYHRQVHFADTDAAGVVYFANLLNFCHEAYEKLLEDIGVDLREFFRDGAIAMPIVEAQVKFFRPLYCGDRLIISIRATAIDASCFQLHYRITPQQVEPPQGTEPDHPSPVAIAETRHICLKMPERQRTPLPPLFQDWLGDPAETQAPQSDD
ncbi:acyl-CoA thioesterase [Candidatus Synechococcus calcipolaris G9]|uniref:1,4-dihydroxy-2-naphthoyl-CoA hydrolase n=1 Tax=Candidatus Synechococcus calcipolaris G9 TaxID=1497997 RepID=A0ABT6F370_9SYNE|nr:thioesterase family protein [Candidatus Synechococcus calcipolaris]MDG2992310.1 acyl-CoA thioesterase [Candidatus Synechococcus calcipolaris G9]